MDKDISYVIALYIRLSLEDIRTDSLSIENQEEILQKYAGTIEEGKNTKILKFIDNGYSGTNFERPAVQELLSMVKEGKIHCIIVKDFSRFGRDSMEVGYFMERVFPLYGIRFISVGDHYDSDSLHGDTGGLSMTFRYLINEFYSRDLSVKSKTAKYIKMRRGEYQSVICPYGYQKSPDGRMEPDKETAPHVQLIFALAGEGNSTSRIIEALFQKGILTPGEYKASKGKAYHDVSRSHHIWQRSTILRILRDERYTGTYIMGKRTVTEVGSHHLRPKDESEWFRIPNHHPALISRELFTQVQAQLVRWKCVKKNTHLYPLYGKVFCGCCRHAMERRAVKKPFFHCRYTKVTPDFPCHGLQIQEAELEDMLYSIFYKQAQLLLDIDVPTNIGTLEKELARQDTCGQEIQKWQDQKRVLYEQLLLQEISTDKYQREKDEIDREINRLEQAYTVLHTKTAQMQMDGETRAAKKKLAQDIRYAGGLTAELAETLIERIYVYPGKQIEIVWKMKDFFMQDIASQEEKSM